MSLSQSDLQNINTFEIPYSINNGVLEINAKSVFIWIDKRPPYCDRGRYLLHVENMPDKLPVVDGADLFPRYYFKMSNLFDELNEWLKINNKNPLF
jgi:hypothetical protein